MWRKFEQALHCSYVTKLYIKISDHNSLEKIVMIAGNSLPRSGSIRWSCLSYRLTVVYIDAKSEPCLLVMHSRCLRHLGEIADGSHHASAMKQNLCCLLHFVSSFSTQLLALYIYSSCSCRCQHNCYLLYNRCTCSSYPFFITTILQAHLGAS